MQKLLCRACNKDITELGINKKYCNVDCYLNHKHETSKEIIRTKIDEIIELFNKGTSIAKLSEQYKISKDLLYSEFKKRNITAGHKRYYGKKSHFWSGYEGISGKYWSGIKSSAVKRKLEFDLDIKDAWNQFIKQNRKCALSGVDLTLDADQLSYKEKSEKINASLDRKNSLKGYTKDNIQWVHKTVNILKNRWNNEEFIHWCNLITEHNKGVL